MTQITEDEKSELRTYLHPLAVKALMDKIKKHKQAIKQLNNTLNKIEKELWDLQKWDAANTTTEIALKLNTDNLKLKRQARKHYNFIKKYRKHVKSRTNIYKSRKDDRRILR